MNKSRTRPTEIIDLQLPDRNLSIHDTKKLVQTDAFRVIQLRMPAGSELPTYEADGEIILHCLEGHVSVRAAEQEHTLEAHQLLFLATNAPFSISAVEHSSILATIVSPSSQRVDVFGGSVVS